eukprot:scaffold26563_cov107-Isochrysis_galbana.AAC.3
MRDGESPAARGSGPSSLRAWTALRHSWWMDTSWPGCAASSTRTSPPSPPPSAGDSENWSYSSGAWLEPTLRNASASRSALWGPAANFRNTSLRVRRSGKKGSVAARTGRRRTSRGRGRSSPRSRRRQWPWSLVPRRQAMRGGR